MKALAWILFIITAFSCAECSKILFLIPLSTRSEKHFFDPIITGVAQSGHEVTVVTSSKSTHLPSNVTEIMPVTVNDYLAGLSDLSDFENIFFDMIFFDNAYYMKICEKVYNNLEFQLILNSKYDLILTNFLFGQCFYGFIYKNQSPFILLNSWPIPNSLLKDFGTYVAPSTVPYPSVYYDSEMTFFQRANNFIIDLATIAYQEWVSNPSMEHVYRKYLGEDLPSISEIHQNASLIMMNTHFTSTYHRSLMPDIIEIGGIHCTEAKPLPTDLEEFVSGSPDGFIYFSLGTVVKGSSLLPSTTKKITNVFSRLKQRVIWKWESEAPEGLSNNVMVKKWLPQQDILGHPNIKLFISHGGLLSTQQTIFHGIPALYFPVFLDQVANAKGAVQQGFALQLDLWNFTEEEFETSIQQLLNNSKFTEKAQTTSAIFKDQMNSPRERAVFWTNFILKHNGAPQLRSSARKLNFIQFHSIDVIAFIITIILSLSIICIYIIKKVLPICFSFKGKPKSKMH